MTSTIIPNDGRIMTKVKITGEQLIPNTPPPEIEKDLIADTGGFTVVPLGNIMALFGFTPIALGPLFDSNFGPMFEVLNGVMKVQVVKPDGSTETRTCDKISAHIQADGTFLTGDGLLGMDQFDTLKADPVKNAAGDKAFIRARTP